MDGISRMPAPLIDSYKATMDEEEPFLRALLADPYDRVTRQVYADWLDDRADPRAEFLRLHARLAEVRTGRPERPGLRQRLSELRALLPSWWLARVGGLRATRHKPDPIGIEVAALALGRGVKATDGFGIEVEICAAAMCPRKGAVVFLESRSRWTRGSQDVIAYTLRLRELAGRATSWEPETYNPYCGCDPQLIEWFGDVVVFVYREKRHTYVARVGFDHRPDYRAIADDWILDGREVVYRHWHAPNVERLSIPDLKTLPPLRAEEAAERDLLPG